MARFGIPRRKPGRTQEIFDTDQFLRASQRTRTIPLISSPSASILQPTSFAHDCKQPVWIDLKNAWYGETCETWHYPRHQAAGTLRLN
jgi:hypothetical protein